MNTKFKTSWFEWPHEINGYYRFLVEINAKLMQNIVEIVWYTLENCLREIFEQSNSENHISQVLTTRCFIICLKEISAIRRNTGSDIQCESFRGNLASRHIADVV